MIRKPNQIVRIALLLVLFQFLAPAFIPVVGQEIPTDRDATIRIQHSSIIVPMFLKEKEEKEDGDISFVSRSAPLLDLTSHSVNLTASHTNKYSVFSVQQGFPHPPLFSLFCTLLI